MNILYTLRSGFTAPCEALIAAQQEQLDAGQEITEPLKAGGYAANIKVMISAADSAGFEAEWASSNPTRFPARVKAAATALRNCGKFGKFAVSCWDGTLSIRRA